MRHTVTVACLSVLVLLTQGVLAQQTKPKPAAGDPAGSLHDVIGKAGPQTRGLLDVIKLAPQDVPKKAVGTFLVPTDAAVAAFLKSMGYTAADLAARPNLVDLIISYHFLPGYQVTGSEVDKGPKRAATGDDNYIVTLDKNPAGKLTVKDVQGNVASVVAGPVKVGNVSVFTIDKVLMSGNYFTDTLAALKFYPSWVTTQGLAQQSGVDQVLADSKDPYTLFVPNVKAWKPVEPAVKAASKAQVANMLKYHVVPGALQVPQDFKDGSLATLLSGQTLKVAANATATSRDPFKGGAEIVAPLVQLTPAVGQPAKVVTYNIYAGKNMIHAIDAVLQPDVTDKAASGAATAPKAPAKVTTETATKPAATGAVPPSPKKPAATDAVPSSPKKPAVPAAPKAGAAPKSSPKAGAATAKTKATPTAATSMSKPGAAATSMEAVAAAAAPALTSPAVAAAELKTSAGRRALSLTTVLQLQQDEEEEEPQEEVKPPEGTITGRTVEVGALQTSPTGFVITRIQEALDAAATGEVPLQYTNRFGSLSVSSAANGCLNCLVWSKP